MLNFRIENTRVSLKGLVACLVFSFYMAGCTGCILYGGQTEKTRDSSPLIGKELTTQKRTFYKEYCNNKHSCGNTKLVRKIDRTLVCNKLDVIGIYNKNYEISSEVFTVKNVIEIGCYGSKCSFGSGYDLAVLEDSNGLRSTILLDFIDFENDDVCGSSF